MFAHLLSPLRLGLVAFFKFLFFFGFSYYDNYTISSNDYMEALAKARRVKRYRDFYLVPNETLLVPMLVSFSLIV